MCKPNCRNSNKLFWNSLTFNINIIIFKTKYKKLNYEKIHQLTLYNIYNYLHKEYSIFNLETIKNLFLLSRKNQRKN